MLKTDWDRSEASCAQQSTILVRTSDQGTSVCSSLIVIADYHQTDYSPSWAFHQDLKDLYIQQLTGMLCFSKVPCKANSDLCSRCHMSNSVSLHVAHVASSHVSCMASLMHSIDAISNLHPETLMSKVHKQLENKFQATNLQRLLNLQATQHSSTATIKAWMLDHDGRLYHRAELATPTKHQADECTTRGCKFCEDQQTGVLC